MAKRVVVHIGYHKTGSSALQAAFSAHHDRLRRQGIAYPRPGSEASVKAGTCIGNAMQIMLDLDSLRLTRPATTRELAERATPRYFAELRRIALEQPEEEVLFSAEFLSALSAEQFAGLRAAMGSGIDLAVLCFVRDPFDYAHSYWKQCIKSGSETKDFDSFIDAPSCPRSLSMLTAFADLYRSGIPLTVLRYETHRKALPQGVLAAMGWMSEAERAAVLVPPGVNPSLGHAQAAAASVLRRSSPNPLLADLYVKRSLAQAPAGAERYYDRQQHRRILAAHADQIALINGHLPAAERLSTADRDLPDTAPALTATDTRLLAEAAAQFAQLAAAGHKRSGLLGRLANRLRRPMLPARLQP